MKRSVTANNPLFHFKGVAWEAIPDRWREYAAISVDAAHADMNERLERLYAAGAPVILQTEFYNSFMRGPVVTPERLDELLNRYNNILGVSMVELSCSNLTDIQRARLMDTLRVCVRHDVYFIWEDMGFPDRRHVFAKAGEDEELFGLIKECSDHFIFIAKINGWGEFFLTQSLAMGSWTTGLCAAWGVNCEDFWWFENNLTRHFKPVLEKRFYNMLLKDCGPGPANNLLTAQEFACPEALIGQMMLTAAMGGACIYSFENPDRVSYYKGKWSPLFERVISPLFDIILGEGILPDLPAVVSRVRAAYHADDWDAPALCGTGEALFRGLYGCNEQSDEFILEHMCTTRVIPSSGRYYYIPVTPTLAEEESERVYGKRLYNSKTLPADKRAAFDAICSPVSAGDACVMNIGDVWLVMNWRETEDTRQDFDFKAGEYRLKGALPANGYILARLCKGELRLHVNNMRLDDAAAIWENASFTRASFMDEYIKSDCPWFDELYLTELHISADRGELKVNIDMPEAFAYERIEEKGSVALALRHNGSVDITVEA